MQQDEPGRSKGRRDTRPWPYVVGTRGVNRVRVYDRADSSIAQIEWMDDGGRQQKSLHTVTGEPILLDQAGKTLARDIAERMSRAQGERRQALSDRRLFGGDSQMTVAELLEALHEHREPEWRASYTRDQRRFREFWLDELEADRPILRVNAALVERIARDAARKNGWSKATHRHYLRYLTEAYSFACEKLKEIEDRHTLSAVSLPRLTRGRGKAYSEDQTRRLIPALWRVDPRAGFVGEAYYQAGRRLNSTRQLRVRDVEIKRLPTTRGEIEAVVVHYPEKTDKAKGSSVAVLVGARVVEGVRALLERPAVRRTGLLCPHGELDDPKAKKRPIRSEILIRDLLPEAEKMAEIEHEKGRAYHGLKRRFAGSSRANRQLASIQAGTTESTIALDYDPRDDLAGQAEFAADMVAKLEGEEVGADA